MTWRHIRAKLRKAGIKQVDLAKRWNKSETSISHFLAGQLHSKSMTDSLAQELGLSPADIPQPPPRCRTCGRPFPQNRRAFP